MVSGIVSSIKLMIIHASRRIKSFWILPQRNSRRLKLGRRRRNFRRRKQADSLDR